jgi:hypothetical protein
VRRPWIRHITLHSFQQKFGACHVTLLYIEEIMILIYLYINVQKITVSFGRFQTHVSTFFCILIGRQVPVYILPLDFNDMV